MQSPIRKPSRRPRTEETNPILASKVIEVAAETLNITKTAEALHVSRPTVREILRRNPEDFVAARKRLATQAMLAADLAATQAIENMPYMTDPYRASLSSKIMGQMALEQMEMDTPAVQINVQMLQEGIRVLRKIEAELAEPEAAPEEPTKQATRGFHAESPAAQR